MPSVAAIYEGFGKIMGKRNLSTFQDDRIVLIMRNVLIEPRKNKLDFDYGTYDRHVATNKVIGPAEIRDFCAIDQMLHAPNDGKVVTIVSISSM